jgi:hypothetical protein
MKIKIEVYVGVVIRQSGCALRRLIGQLSWTWIRRHYRYDISDKLYVI